MFNPDQDAPPLNPLPVPVVVIAVIIAAVELLFQAGEGGFVGGAQSIGWRLEAVQRFGFSDQIWAWMLETRTFPPHHLLRFVAYPFVHGSFLHALFVIVFVLAIGKMVSEVFSPVSVVVIFLTAPVAGALVYALLLDTNMPLFGGYPAVYGLIGAFTYILWVRARSLGQNQWRAFGLVGFLLAFQLTMKLAFGGGNDWIADIAGFGTGFGLSFLLSPGGSRRLSAWVAQVRKR